MLGSGSSLRLTVPVTSNAGLYCLEVGQGDSHLVVRDRRGVLIDGGPPRVGQRLFDFLTKRVDVLEAVVLTHNDADHSGGLLCVLNNQGKAGKIREFWGLLDRPPKPNSRSMRAVELAMELHDEGKLVARRLEGLPRAPTLLTRLGRLAFHALFPDFPANARTVGGASPSPNDTSGAILLSHSGTGLALWLGDLPAEKVQSIREEAEVSARLFVVPHHGSGDKWSDADISDTLGQVSPSSVVVSVGTDNTYGHPDTRWLSKSTNRRVLCTQATTQCDPRIGKRKGLTRGGQFDPGQGKPCAGTIVYTICADGTLRLREPRAHADNVGTLACPQCT